MTLGITDVNLDDGEIIMAVLSLSSRAFMERLGVRKTLRRPMPTEAPGRLGVVNTPVEKPWPLPELMFHREGSPAPDRGQSEEWPHGGS